VKRRVDLVADLGEGFGHYKMGEDDAMLELVSSANIACGFHAGDPRIMDATVGNCARLGVHVGAHPGFLDLVGFGRRALDASPAEIETDVLYQLGALDAFTRAHGLTLQHVSPHGRLGNLVVTDEHYALPVARAVARFDPTLIVLGQTGRLLDIATEMGLPTAAIGFADRAYNDDGTLVSRLAEGAVLHDEDEIAARVMRMVTEGVVSTVSGVDLPIRFDSILLHGDNLGAVSFARRVRAELTNAGVEITPLSTLLGIKPHESVRSR